MHAGAVAMREGAHRRPWGEYLDIRVLGPRNRRAIARDAPRVEPIAAHQVWRAVWLKDHERAVGERLQLLSVGQLDLVALVEVAADALGVQRPVDRIHVWR